MTTTLENSNTQLQWNYAENLKDGRGITFGIIGFCTGTYDGNILLKYYTGLNPDNTLARYIPALNKIDAGSHNAAGGGGNPTVKGLDGFITDVQNCNDPLFKQAQLYELDQLYWNPTVKEFNKIGARYPLTLALMYDASVREGVDGMQEIVSNCGGTPKSGIDEITFDKNFIKQYTALLEEEGIGDKDRMAGFSQILKSKNVELNTPFTFIAYGESFTINGDLGVDISDSDPAGSAPVASFSAKTRSGVDPLQVLFADKSTGSPVSWKWNFGDGTYSTEKNPEHTYTKSGKYKVSLTVKNSKGSNTATKSSDISVAAPQKASIAAFSAFPTSGKVPLKVQFTDKSTNSPTSWKWSFGDGTYSTSKNPSHTYRKAGKYTVSLTVKNSKGSDKVKKSSYITVMPLKTSAARSM
jgi:chitosanase